MRRLAILLVLLLTACAARALEPTVSPAPVSCTLPSLPEPSTSTGILDLPFHAIQTAADPYHNRLYVLDETDTLHIVTGDKVIAERKEVAGFRLVVNPLNRRLYAASDSQTLILDGETGEQVGIIPLGGEISLNLCGNRLLITDVDGLHLYDADSGALLGTIPGLIRIAELNEEMRRWPARTFDVYPRGTLPNPANGDFYVMMANPRCLHGGCWSETDLKVYDGQNYHVKWEMGGTNGILDPANGHFYAVPKLHPDTYLPILNFYDQTYTHIGRIGNVDGALHLDPVYRRLYVLNDRRVVVIDVDQRQIVAAMRVQEGWEVIGVLHNRLMVRVDEGLRLIPSDAFAQANRSQVQDVDALTQVITRIARANQTDTLFASGYDGLYRSHDDGDTWQQIFACGEPSPVIAPDDTLFVDCSFYNPTREIGMYRSSDYGDTWESINQGLPSLAFKVEALSPSFGDDQTLWATENRYFGTGRVVSHDGGRTWTPDGESPLTRPIMWLPSPTPPATPPALPEQTCDGKTLADAPRLLADTENRPTFADSGESIYRLDEANTCWQPTGITYQQRDYPSSIPGDAPSVLYGDGQILYALTHSAEPHESSFIYRSTLYRSSDNGLTWEIITQGQIG